MTAPDDKTLGVMDDKALSLALLFHETYERLAPNYGYETRIATRKFDPDSPNGQLMIAVCGEIYRERIATLEAERDDLQERARLVDASISCAAMGHYKRGEPMHEDYKTVGLNDVLDLRDKWIAAEAERDALRQLMLEARDWFHPRDPKVPGALVDMCDRIDAALKEEAAWCLRQRDKDGERIATRVEACYLDYDPTKTIDAARAALKEKP